VHASGKGIKEQEGDAGNFIKIFRVKVQAAPSPKKREKGKAEKKKTEGVSRERKDRLGVGRPRVVQRNDRPKIPSVNGGVLIGTGLFKGFAN